MLIDKRQVGVTLIELMVTVAIVAILAAIAYPSYRNQVMRSNRSVARTALLTYAQTLEKCFTQNSSYSNPVCPGIAADSSAFDSGRAFYSIAFNPAVAPITFTLVATAQGPQASDTACPTLSIDQRGQRLPAACW